jgi:hypothetical protein
MRKGTYNILTGFEDVLLASGKGKKVKLWRPIGL